MIVFDLYEWGKIRTTYQTRRKAEAARYRLGAGAIVKKRLVKNGLSPRWKAAPKRCTVSPYSGAEMACAAAILLGLKI